MRSPATRKTQTIIVMSGLECVCCVRLPAASTSVLNSRISCLHMFLMAWRCALVGRSVHSWVTVSVLLLKVYSSSFAATISASSCLGGVGCGVSGRDASARDGQQPHLKPQACWRLAGSQRGDCAPIHLTGFDVRLVWNWKIDNYLIPREI